MLYKYLSIIGFVLFAACNKSAELQPRQQIEIAKGTLGFNGVYYGDLQAKEANPIHAPKPMGIWTMTIESLVPDGTPVKKGDVVMRFATDPIADQLAAEETTLAVNRASLIQLEHSLEKERIDLDLEVKRKKMALERAELDVVEGVNFRSAIDVDKAKIEVEKAAVELKLATKALKMFAQKKKTALNVERIKVDTQQRKVAEIKKALTMMEIQAPADGVLYAPYSRLNFGEREKPAPGKVVRQGNKVLEIPDLSVFQAVVYLRQKDATLVKKGDKAKIYPAILPDRVVTGSVESIESFATSRNERLGTNTPAGNLKEVVAVVTLDEAPSELKPGGSARVEIESIRAKDVILVPLAALEEKNGSYVVTTADGKKQTVAIGESSHTHAEVKSGLSPGDRVLL